MAQQNRGQLILVARALSLADIALIAGVSRPTVSRWKKGEITPAMRQRAALEASLNIPSVAWDTPLQPGEFIPADVHIKSGRKAKHRPLRFRQPDDFPRTMCSDCGQHLGAPGCCKHQAQQQASSGNGTPQAAPEAPQAAYQAPQIPAYPEASPDASTLDMVRHTLACLQHDLKHRPYTAAGRSKARMDETRTLALIAKLEATEELKEDRYVRDHPEWQRLRACILRALESHPDAAKDVMNAMRLEFEL